MLLRISRRKDSGGFFALIVYAIGNGRWLVATGSPKWLLPVGALFAFLVAGSGRPVQKGESMNNPTERLRQIADEIRSLPHTFRVERDADAPDGPGWDGETTNGQQVCNVGGKLLSEAMDGQAFIGAEYSELRTLRLYLRDHRPDDWSEPLFQLALARLMPALRDVGPKNKQPSATMPECCDFIANLLDTEIKRMELAPITPLPAPGQHREAAARQPKKRKRKTDPKAAQRKAKDIERRKREDAILKEWEAESWENYDDYARTKNGKLPTGWPELIGREIYRAVAAAKARQKRKPKRPNKADAR